MDELAFDPTGWLVSWASGVTTDAFLYDGEGNRVELAATESTSATTTSVDGGREEIATNGSSSTLTTYFPSVSALPSFTEGRAISPSRVAATARSRATTRRASAWTATRSTAASTCCARRPRSGEGVTLAGRCDAFVISDRPMRLPCDGASLQYALDHPSARRVHDPRTGGEP